MFLTNWSQWLLFVASSFWPYYGSWCYTASWLILRAFVVIRKLSEGIEIPSKGHSNMVDQRSSSAPNVHNIISDANFRVSCLPLQTRLCHSWSPYCSEICWAGIVWMTDVRVQGVETRGRSKIAWKVVVEELGLKMSAPEWSTCSGEDPSLSSPCPPATMLHLAHKYHWWLTWRLIWGCWR